MAILKPLSRDTLTKQVADTLRRLVLTETVKPGDALPSERDLSETLSVSRNIVREALTVLVAEGLIVKKPGSGIFVTDFDRTTVSPSIAVNLDYDGRDVVALSEARSAVELGAVELMVTRITEAQLAQLEEINQELAEKLDQQRSTVRHDIEFHTVLFEATHNPVLVNLVPLLVEYFRLSVAKSPDVIVRSHRRIVAEHGRIIDALRRRDVAATRQALLAHLDPPGSTPWSLAQSKAPQGDADPP